jgi:hypothetical protein
MILDLKREYETEAYQYFHDNVRSFPLDKNGQIIISAETAHNNDVDAFRHAYVSGAFTIKYNNLAANILGQLNELKGNLKDQPKEEENMDLWNNKVGREYGEKASSRKKLAELLKSALKNKELIETIDQKKDSRQYQEDLSEEKSKVDPNKSVIVLSEKDTGRNEWFLDLFKDIVMDKDTFVNQINAGQYPGYNVANIYDELTPMSKPDGSSANNLG